MHPQHLDALRLAVEEKDQDRGSFEKQNAWPVKNASHISFLELTLKMRKMINDGNLCIYQCVWDS